MPKLSPLLLVRLVGSRLWGSSPALARRRQPRARYYIYLLRSSPAPHLLCAGPDHIMSTTLGANHRDITTHIILSLLDIIKPPEVKGSQFSSWLLLSGCWCQGRGWWSRADSAKWTGTGAGARDRRLGWSRAMPGPGLQWAVSGGHWGQGSWCSEVAEQEHTRARGELSGCPESGARRQGPGMASYHQNILSLFPLTPEKTSNFAVCKDRVFAEWD